MSRRVVVTGLGTVNSLGHSVQETWQAIKESQCGVGRITRVDTKHIDCKIAAEVKDFNPSTYVSSKDCRKMDLFSVFAAYASLQALEDSGLVIGKNVMPERVGTIIGNGIGGIMTLENAYEKFFNDVTSSISPMVIPKHISNEGPGNVAILAGAQGPCYSLMTACSAGTDAISDAYRWIKDGTCDAMITGGTEAGISLLGVGGFCSIKAVTTKFNDAPQKASRPFDKDRSGFVMGEGAGILILEEYEHAMARNAKIYAELVGFGMTCDAYHLTSPHPDGIVASRAIQMALNMAGLGPKEVDYINAHGTSTPINDPSETRIIKRVFGDHAYNIKISSTKSMIGHCIGAAGSIEAIFCIMAICDQWVPPTINLDCPDISSGCDLDYVPHKGVSVKVNVAMSNTFGFGGHNGILIFKKL